MTAFIYNPPLEPYLSVVYQDEDLLVLDKPSGLLSVAGRLAEHHDSLQIRVQRVFPTATIIHRLDMSTSGIMLMALNKVSHRELSRQFEKREISKRYLALVWSQPGETSGSIDLPLICDWPNRPRQKVCFEHGKPSLTRWQLLEYYANQSSLVELEPVTGRSHQLRVHMQSIGHPILGDKFYAHPEAFQLHPRLALHASEIQFRHPVSGEQMHFKVSAEFERVQKLKCV
jgi:tRNA pseudouridine32 synthase/23S rRNA pseudouridine746 synthase